MHSTIPDPAMQDPGGPQRRSLDPLRLLRLLKVNAAWPRRILRLSALFFGVALLLTCLMIYLGHTLFISQGALAAVGGDDTRSHAALTRFQIGFERLGHLVLRHSAGLDPDPDVLLEEHRRLQAQFAEIADYGGADAEELPEGFPAQVQGLRPFMRELDVSLPRVLDDGAALRALVRGFEASRAPLEEMVQSMARFEQERTRDSFGEVSMLRRAMYASGLLLWTNFAVWVTLLLLGARQSRVLIGRQKAAIEAEHQAVEAARRALVNKNTMLGMISHELRTPLQTIISSIDLLALHQQKTQQKDSAVVTRLGEASVQLEAQLKDLTDYVRLDAARLALRFAPCRPAAILRAVVANFETQAQRKGLRLVADIPACDGIIVSDEYRIRQIASNLISNAIKYSEQGEVRVRLEPLAADGRLRLSVSDDGPGIAQEDVPRLFEPFTQIDQSHTRRHDGAGLGLAIVKGLVELFGGQLKVDSQVGLGTRFTVCLPVSMQEAAAPAPAPPAPAEAQVPVLLIDDNDDVRASLKEVLEQLGYQCDSAGGGAQGLAKAAQQRYAAILLDIQMPGMDGFAVAARLRDSDGPNRDTPIIGISAYALKQNGDAELRYFSTYLMKPIRHERLRALLEAGLPPGE
jgi:signal transduction histidine kinase/CheY-like chemotaxis protein